MRAPRWAQITLVGMTMASCAQAKDEPRPSLVPELLRMAPVIACIDAAPRDAWDAITACAKRAGIPVDVNQSEPETATDFKQRAVLTWLMLNRGPNRPLNQETFAKAVDYAKCVETAAYADVQFSSRTRKGVEEARLHADLACKDHPLSLRGLDANGATAAPDLAGRLVANSLANLTLMFALKANGWFPDEMRPCVRYLDGRPPSAGCTGKSEAQPPPPPKI